MTAARAFIGLGANIGEPLDTLRAALRDLDRLPHTRLVSASSFYRSAPVGFTEQPDFINAVALLETTLAPRALLDDMLAIEQRHGRRRQFANAPRTLDLDLLMYGELEIRETGLILPHPRMHERAFVLVPLLEVDPEARIPRRGRAADLALACRDQAVHRIEQG